MVITALPDSGIKCQVGEFNLLVDAPQGKRGDLVLETKKSLPIDSFSSPDLIYGPGEYEISGVKIKGISINKEIPSGHWTAAYNVEFEGISLGFLGEISSELSDESLDKFGEVDILFFSADTKKLKPKELISVIKQINPQIIIPTTDKTAKYISEEMGQKIKAEEKIVIKKKDLAEETTGYRLVWLRETKKIK
jgi:hypothetical protein